jgi:hypothetical protein
MSKIKGIKRQKIELARMIGLLKIEMMLI